MWAYNVVHCVFRVSNVFGAFLAIFRSNKYTAKTYVKIGHRDRSQWVGFNHANSLIYLVIHSGGDSDNLHHLPPIATQLFNTSDKAEIDSTLQDSLPIPEVKPLLERVNTSINISSHCWHFICAVYHFGSFICVTISPTNFTLLNFLHLQKTSAYHGCTNE